jgi:hypothetical protein
MLKLKFEEGKKNFYFLFKGTDIKLHRMRFVLFYNTVSTAGVTMCRGSEGEVGWG